MRIALKRCKPLSLAILRSVSKFRSFRFAGPVFTGAGARATCVLAPFLIVGRGAPPGLSCGGL